MANPDDTNAGGSTGGTSGEGADAQRLSIEDPDYPKYRITFNGPLAPNPTQVVTGPHTLTLLSPSTRIQIELTRNPADPNIPDLNITITELPEK